MAELRTGTQKSLSFIRPFRSGFLGTGSQNRLVWEPYASLSLLNIFPSPTSSSVGPLFFPGRIGQGPCQAALRGLLPVSHSNHPCCGLVCLPYPPKRPLEYS